MPSLQSPENKWQLSYPIRTLRDKYTPAASLNEWMTRNGHLCETAYVATRGLLSDLKFPAPTMDNMWFGWPWITPVLGSGCLSIQAAASESFRIERAAITAWIGAAKETFEVGFDKVWFDHAADFVNELVRHRAPHLYDEERAGRESTGGVPFTMWQAHLCMLAYAITEAFRAWLVESAYPIDQWRSEKIVLDDEHAGWDDILLARDIITHLLAQFESKEPHELIVRLAEPDQEDIVVATLSMLLTRAREVLRGLEQLLQKDQVSLRREDVQWVTEIAWNLLLLGTPAYPRWSDLLFALRLAAGPNEEISTFGPYRPRFRGIARRGGLHLNELIQGLLRMPTVKSWNSGAEVSVRDAFYGEIAAMLNTHYTCWVGADSGTADGAGILLLPKLADRVVKAAPDDVKLYTLNRFAIPFPTAFVSSFDLELEMALWRAGKPFHVAMPVQALPIRGGGVLGKIFWVHTRIEPIDSVGEQQISPEDQFDLLTRPTEWRLLPSDNTDLDGPLVVRLTSCPLFEMDEDLLKHPVLAADLLGVELQGDADADRTLLTERLVEQVQTASVTVSPSVSVDEYVSLHAAQAELYWLVGDTERKTMPGLPAWVMGNPQGNARFWVFLGVQFADWPIRLRLFTNIYGPLLKDLASGKRKPGGGGASGNGDRDGDGSARLARSTSGLGPKPKDDDPPPPEALVDHMSILGVAVNKRLSSDDAYLLRWLGLDVVTNADGADLTGEFADYRRHMEAMLGETITPDDLDHFLLQDCSFRRG